MFKISFFLIQRNVNFKHGKLHLTDEVKLFTDETVKNNNISSLSFLGKYG